MKRFAMFVLLFAVASGMMIFADIVPYSDPSGQGTQSWGGNLALTFNVNSAITVNGLGVYNASGSGFITGTIQVAIFDTTTNTEVTPLATFHGPSTLGAQGYDVFQSIAPVVLGIGSYEVDAVGFSGADPNGNLNTGSSSGPLLNNDGGRLTFTGAAWDYDSASLDDPTMCLTCKAAPTPQSQQFDAGTFSVPEPSFYDILGGFGAVIAVLLTVGRRRKVALGTARAAN